MAAVIGCGGSAYGEVCESVKSFENGRNIRKVSPFAVPRIMPSSAVANISLIYGIKGECYDISCACTSGAMSIIAAARLILSGEYDIVMAGGSEELAWQDVLGFTVMRAVARGYKDCPSGASRPFDKGRSGFVM